MSFSESENGEIYGELSQIVADFRTKINTSSSLLYRFRCIYADNQRWKLESGQECLIMVWGFAKI